MRSEPGTMVLVCAECFRMPAATSSSFIAEPASAFPRLPRSGFSSTPIHFKDSWRKKKATVIIFNAFLAVVRRRHCGAVRKNDADTIERYPKKSAVYEFSTESPPTTRFGPKNKFFRNAVNRPVQSSPAGLTVAMSSFLHATDHMQQCLIQVESSARVKARPGMGYYYQVQHDNYAVGRLS